MTIGKGRSNLPFTSNLDLSLGRAKMVAKKLTDLGVDKKRIAVIGYGSKRPIAPNNTPEGRAKNRRVEIKIIEP